jgi:DNA-binding response OmpR family regulator
VHILVATDAQWVLDDVMAALSSPSTSFTVITNGREVSKAVQQRTPDIAILDLQVGAMGGMAITMDLRLDHSSGRMPHVPVLMLLDRKADIHLARRSGANGWLIKPLNALTLRRAAQEIAAGGCFAEGLTQPVVEDITESVAEDADAVTSNDDTASADSLTH